MKLLQYLFISLLVVSIFSISSVDIVEESSETLTEKNLKESKPQKDVSDKFLQDYSVYTLKDEVTLHLQTQCLTFNSFYYNTTLLRPPINS